LPFKCNLQRYTSETYLAGVVFMVGTNFILLGSTKVRRAVQLLHAVDTHVAP
jgi:hypothetical protein